MITFYTPRAPYSTCIYFTTYNQNWYIRPFILFHAFLTFFGNARPFIPCPLQVFVHIKPFRDTYKCFIGGNGVYEHRSSYSNVVYIMHLSFQPSLRCRHRIEDKVGLGLDMSHEGFARGKYATQSAFYIQHYFPMGIKDWSVRLGVHNTLKWEGSITLVCIKLWCERNNEEKEVSGGNRIVLFSQ